MKFKQTLRQFLSSKSNWTGMTMIGVGLIGMQNNMDTVTSFQSIFGGLALIFVRDAIHAK